MLCKYNYFFKLQYLNKKSPAIEEKTNIDNRVRFGIYKNPKIWNKLMLNNPDNFDWTKYDEELENQGHKYEEYQPIADKEQFKEKFITNILEMEHKLFNNTLYNDKDKDRSEKL